MCGFLTALQAPGKEFETSLLACGLEMMHRRGPDAVGQWADTGVWMGHRRLAIVDLDVRSND